MNDSTITIRTNLYLWFLTGRSEDFVNDSLNTRITYSIKETPDEVKRARVLLGLDNTKSDFNVLAVLAASKMSTSMLRDMTPELDCVFVRGLLRLPNVESTAVMLPLTDASWPYFSGKRAGADGFTTITFQAVDATQSLIRTDAGASESTSHATVTEDGGTLKVVFNKAPDYGVNAAFRVNSWNAGDQIVLTVPQTRYPFATVADLIDKDRNALQLMNAEGTMQAYGESSNPAIKVGMLGLAIIRRMLRLTNEEQAGFAVTVTTDEDGVEPLQQLYEIDPSSVTGLDVPKADEEAPIGFDA